MHTTTDAQINAAETEIIIDQIYSEDFLIGSGCQFCVDKLSGLRLIHLKYDIFGEILYFQRSVKTQRWVCSTRKEPIFWKVCLKLASCKEAL